MGWALGSDEAEFEGGITFNENHSTIINCHTIFRHFVLVI